MRDCTIIGAPQEVVREAELDRAGLLEARALLVVEATSSAPRLSSSCASVRAPMIGAVTAGLSSVQASRDLRRAATDLGGDLP